MYKNIAKPHVAWKATFLKLTQVKPMHPIAPHNISASMAGYELAVGKYAKKKGLCQCVT